MRERFDKRRQFEVLTAVLAAVDERGSAPLAEFAERFDVDLGDLHRVVADATLCEFRTTTNEVVSFTDSFLLQPDEVLVKTADHWLRDLVSVPPEPETVLRLMLAATAVRALDSIPLPDLDSAIAKLRRVMSAEVVIADSEPEWLTVVDRAWRQHRRLRFRYVKDGHTDATDRVIEPHIVYSRWGHWYVEGLPAGEDSPKVFRVDRIVEAAVGDERFDPPGSVEVPDWFDLSAVEHTVRIRAPVDALASIPQPYRAGQQSTLPDGRVEVDVTIAGAQRLDHLLLVLAPECEILNPPSLSERRRALAEELLALYE